jgi:molybdopterin-guanine dinucleotide biosynthesis protein A
MTSAAILAGGRGRRLGGTDKSQLRVHGRTMLERQVDLLQDTVDRILLVGARPGVPLDLRLTPVADRVPDCGPLGGLDAALAASGDAPVLLLACDMPNVSRSLVAHLLGQLGAADAVVPRTERGYHPLCAVYAPSCVRAVRRRLDEGQLRMRDLLADLNVRTVEAAELERFGEAGHLLANVNTQADLDALESLRNH